MNILLHIISWIGGPNRLLLLTSSFILSFSLALYITPKVREVALRLNIVDLPDKGLKAHKEPIPYCGGIAVYIAFLVTLALTYDFGQEVLGLLLGGSIVMVIGIIDDLKVLPPGLKLIGQCLAILALMKAGITIRLVFLPVWISIPLTFLWLLVITNAFNLIDIMDGLSGGVAVITCFFLFLVANANGRTTIAIMTLSLGGSILGFLRYNFHPAKIYLGDTGSLFIGLMLGAIAMIGSYTDKNLISALSPVLILGVPIFDTVFVSYLRYRKKRPIYLGSNDHFALRLKRLSLGPVQIVLVSYWVAILLGCAGVWMMRLTNWGAFGVLSGMCMALLLSGYLLKKVDIERPR